MMGSVANGIRRATIPPSASALNKLNLALEKALETDVVNGTSAAAVPSFSGSQIESSTVSASQSDATLVQSSASAVSDVSSGFSSALPESASDSTTTSATSAVSVSASEKLTSEPQSASSLVSPSQRSASDPEPSPTIPKNAVAAPTSLAASSTSSDAPAASKSASLQTNNTSSIGPSSVRTDTPQTSSSSAPETTSQTPTTSSQAPATSRASSTSAVISTQHAQTSASEAPESSSTTAQAPTSSSPRASEQQPASTSASPQSSGSQSPSVARVQNSAADANSRSSQSLSTASLTDNLGNSLIGVTSASSSVHADTTLSTPEAVTITSGSSTFTMTPAFFTSISVSSGKNGSPPQTFTSIIANPTGLPTSAGVSNWTFWDNKGAIAGIFTVIALAVLGAVLSVFYCCRRRRRRMERGALANVQFQRFSGIQDMSQRPTTYQAVRGHNHTSPSYKYDPSRYLMAPSVTSGLSHGHEDQTNMQRSASQNSHRSSDPQIGALGLTGVFGSSSGNVETYDGPFSDYFRSSTVGDSRLSAPPGEPVGIAFSSDLATKAKTTGETQPERAPDGRPPSPAPSTPSLYPPSLAPVPEKDEDNYLFYERETQRRPESKLPTPPPRAVINDSDSNLQNPFASPLDPVYDAMQRQSIPPVRVLTNGAYRPLTPPDSSSSHSPTTPQFAEPTETVKPLNISPYSNVFLGRPVSLRNDPLPRPKRNPLRSSAHEASLKDGELP